MTLPDGSLFPRDWLVRVQTGPKSAIAIAPGSLDIEFKILRNLKPTPNRCTVTVWNLNPDYRAQIYQRNRPQGPTGPQVPVNVQVEAGYVGQRWVIFSGDLREAVTRRMQTDWHTTLALDDGGAAVRAARLPDNGIHFAAGTTVGQVFDQLCKALGIGVGNATQFEPTAQIVGSGTILPGSFTVEGSAHEALKRICDSIGVTFSIQGGVLQILPRGQPLNASAIVLSPFSGLLDSPEAAIDSTVSLGFNQQAKGQQTSQSTFHPKNTSILKAKAMLIPGLVPGRRVELQSAAFKGDYYITEAEYVGQSWAQTWWAMLVLRTYQ